MDENIIGEFQLRRVLSTYSRAADRLDRDLLETICHDDAVIDMGEIYQGGPAGFIDVVEQFMGQMAATRHDLGNLFVLDAGPHHASGETYVQAWHRIETPEETRELTVYGRYVTRIEERGGHWAITSHTEVIDWAREEAVDPTWFDNNTEMPKGQRDKSDLSYSIGA